MKILAKNLLILASAGSGKTYQLGNRVIGLVVSGVAPERIVALTFTRKAAGEFADAVLTKLAAAADEVVAAPLGQDLAMAEADFAGALDRVVRVLPRFTLGTMDSFFSKVVRGFQYELGLTGGKFDLLEGPRLAAAQDKLLEMILGDGQVGDGGEEFFQAFRRALIGKEDAKVLAGLRNFVREWQGRYRAGRDLTWGPDSLTEVALEAWEERKRGLMDQVRQDIGMICFTHAKQQAGLEAALTAMENHTIGSGSLGKVGSLLESVMAAVAANAGGPLMVRFYKEFVIDGKAGEVLREAVMLAAGCEMAAALSRTRAVRDVVAAYDRICDNLLRRRGMLGFDDVKLLMGEWAGGEDARIRREAVDFRLDARYDHWLLDEFQDTSRADWLGLAPLMDEAATGDDGSMFVVGDRKQAIYAWRGGEVGLFDEVMKRYHGGLEIEPMEESWRSCPEVLALVNHVCGDTATMRGLFGGVAARWDWRTHVSAPKLLDPAKRGEARVEVVDGKWPDRLDRLVGLLGELEVGRRKYSCGILVRSNALVREVADHLRAAGFDVIEEGRREPAKDNPVGITLGQLLKWLADPGNNYAREVVAMSPLAAGLHDRFGGSWLAVWEGLSVRAGEVGWAGMVEELVSTYWQQWSEYGRHRAGDVIGALAALDGMGGATARDAADWIERLEVSQSPGVAAVQVMTIHKAKGLGFDVVVVPDVPDSGIPQPQYFTVADGDGWLSQTPPKWARDVLPQMREAETRWAADQRYEGFCTLYVALTRAKRGLYVLLEKPADKRDPDTPSLTNWLERALAADGTPGVIYQAGAADWIETVTRVVDKPDPAPRMMLGAAVARRGRLVPSAAGHSHSGMASTGSPGGALFGSDVHAAFERVAWVDESAPDLPPSAAGQLVAGLLADPAIRGVFERRGRRVGLFREQPIDALINGQWLSGVIDRLHLHYDATGMVTRVEILDFKTDAVNDTAGLLDRHAVQMQAYGNVMKLIHPAATVDCLIVSTHLRVIAKVIFNGQT